MRNLIIGLFLVTIPFLDSSERPPLIDQSKYEVYEDIVWVSKENFDSKSATNVIAQSSILASLGLGFLALTFGMITIITPDSDKYTRALRKAQKLRNQIHSNDRSSNNIKAPHNADGATSSWHSIVMSLLACIAWYGLIQNTDNLTKVSL